MCTHTYVWIHICTYSIHSYLYIYGLSKYNLIIPAQDSVIYAVTIIVGIGTQLVVSGFFKMEVLQMVIAVMILTMQLFKASKSFVIPNDPQFKCHFENCS